MGGGISGTLDSNYFKGQGERAGTEREVVCVGNGQLHNMSMDSIANSLDTMHDQQAVVYASDVYNGKITGDVTASLTANTGSSATHSGATVVYGLDRASFNQGQTAYQYWYVCPHCGSDDYEELLREEDEEDA